MKKGGLPRPPKLRRIPGASPEMQRQSSTSCTSRIPPSRGERNFELESEGRRSWQEDVLRGVGDVEQTVRRHMARYPKNVCRLSPFDSTGRAKTREGLDLLAGRKRESLDDRARTFGRFLVAVGGHWEVSIIFPEELNIDVPDLPNVQFDPGAVDLLQKAVERVVSGPYVSKVERGEFFNRRVHLMVAHRIGACPVGYHRLNGPKDALPCARYFAKKPHHDFENLLGYVQAFQEYGFAAKRLRSGRLGRGRVTVGDVQALLPHLDLLKPEPIEVIAAPLVIEEKPADGVEMAGFGEVSKVRHYPLPSVPTRLPRWPADISNYYALMAPLPLSEAPSALAQRLTADKEAHRPLRRAHRRAHRPHHPIAASHYGVSPPVGASLSAVAIKPF
jgi:hypothetical protein